MLDASASIGRVFHIHKHAVEEDRSYNYACCQSVVCVVTKGRPGLQDRDDIPDHGPEGVGLEDDIVDEAAANEEENEADGEDLLDENMWKYVFQ